MQPSKLPGLIADLELVRSNLRRVARNHEEVIASVGSEPEFFLNSAASVVLQDFYNTVEKSFEQIAVEIDGSLPSGDAWHYQLLKRMSVAIPGRRPAFIDQELAHTLHEYLRFRHLFRNIYGFDLYWERIEPLLVELPPVLESFLSSVDAFLLFLNSLLEAET